MFTYKRTRTKLPLRENTIISFCPIKCRAEQILAQMPLGVDEAGELKSRHMVGTAAHEVFESFGEIFWDEENDRDLYLTLDPTKIEAYFNNKVCKIREIANDLSLESITNGSDVVRLQSLIDDSYKTYVITRFGEMITLDSFLRDSLINKDNNYIITQAFSYGISQRMVS